MVRHGDFVTFTVPSYESLVADTPLRFPAPFADGPGCADFEYYWHLITYAFNLHDPRKFGSLLPRLAEDDRLRLNRYVEVCENIASGEFIKYPRQFEIGLVPDQPVVRSIDEPPSENTRGFSVYFRQLYSSDEPASFSAARRILGNAVHGLPKDEVRNRKEQLTEWRRAVAALRRDLLSVVVGKVMRTQGILASRGHLPGEAYSPEYLISVFDYGSNIHWDKHRDMYSVIQASNNPVTAMMRVNYHESVLALTHVFLGFSLLVKSALANT